MRNSRPLMIAYASLFVLAGCSSDSVAPAATIETTTFAPSLSVDLAAMTRTQAGVYRRDLVVGNGPVVARSQTLDVRYTGWLANGNQFDSNPAPKPVFSFRLGSGQVIAGWDDGIEGMRVGGRRQLIIPPGLGYGSSGSGPIPANAVLVFVVEVVSAQ